MSNITRISCTRTDDTYPYIIIHFQLNISVIFCIASEISHLLYKPNANMLNETIYVQFSQLKPTLRKLQGVAGYFTHSLFVIPKSVSMLPCLFVIVQSTGRSIYKCAQ